MRPYCTTVVDASSVIQVTLTEPRLTFETRTFEISGGVASGAGGEVLPNS